VAAASAEDGGRAAILVRDGKARRCWFVASLDAMLPGPPKNSLVTALAASRQPVSRTPPEEGRVVPDPGLADAYSQSDPPTPYRLSLCRWENVCDPARAIVRRSVAPVPQRRAGAGHH
jgi:hypothetical protein